MFFRVESFYCGIQSDYRPSRKSTPCFNYALQEELFTNHCVRGRAYPALLTSIECSLLDSTYGNRWLSSVPPPARIFIYAKCGTSSLPAFDRFAHFQVLELPNMGMESLAYASHIVRVADRDIVPGQYTLFLQGAPFEHAVGWLVWMSQEAGA